MVKKGIANMESNGTETPSINLDDNYAQRQGLMILRLIVIIMSMCGLVFGFSIIIGNFVYWIMGWFIKVIPPNYVIAWGLQGLLIIVLSFMLFKTETGILEEAPEAFSMVLYLSIFSMLISLTIGLLGLVFTIAYFVLIISLFTSNVKQYWYREFIEDMKPRLKETRYSLYLIRKSPLVVIGILIIIFMTSIALLAPFIATYDGEERVWADTSPITGGLAPGSPSNDLKKTNEPLIPQTSQDIELYPELITGELDITKENVETGEPPRIFFGAEVVSTGYDEELVIIHIAMYEIDLETFDSLSTSQREPYLVEEANATNKVTQYISLTNTETTYVYAIWFVANQKTDIWSVNIRVILQFTSFYPDHIWGTDNYGQDIYSRVIWGAQEDLRIAISVVIVGVTVGSLIGAASGYFGGKFDELVMRITDIFFAFPGLVLAMAIVMALGERNLANISIALMVTWWPTYARLVRGQVLTEREKLYIEAARSVGATDTRILLVHILPNTVQPLIVQATMDIGSVLLVAAGLAYIGFGPPVGTPEWGLMIATGQDYILIAPWMTLYPGIAILVTAIAFNLVGDGIRDILDPKLRRR